MARRWLLAGLSSDAPDDLPPELRPGKGAGTGKRKRARTGPLAWLARGGGPDASKTISETAAGAAAETALLLATEIGAAMDAVTVIMEELDSGDIDFDPDGHTTEPESEPEPEPEPGTGGPDVGVRRGGAHADTDTAATQPEQAMRYAEAMGRPEVAAQLDAIQAHTISTIEAALGNFNQDALDMVLVRETLDRTTARTAERAFIPPEVRDDTSPETIVVTTLIAAAAADWNPAACAGAMAALCLLAAPGTDTASGAGDVTLPVPATRGGAGGLSMGSMNPAGPFIFAAKWMWDRWSMDTVQAILQWAGDVESDFERRMGEDPMSPKGGAGVFDLAFGVIYRGFLKPMITGAVGMTGCLWVYVSELCGIVTRMWRGKEPAASPSREFIKAYVKGSLSGGGSMLKLLRSVFGTGFSAGQLWALYFGMRGYFQLFTLRMGPLLNSALAITLVSLANAKALGPKDDFADRLWTYLAKHTTLDMAEKQFATPGSYGHSVLALGTCYLRRHLGLTEEGESGGFALLGSLRTGIEACMAAFESVAKLDIGSKFVPTVATLAGPLQVLFDMAGCSVALGPAFVLVMCCTGFGRMAKEKRSPHVRELLLATTIAAAAGVFTYACMATPIFVCLAGPASTLVTGAGTTYETLLTTIRAVVFFAVPAGSAGFAAGVTDSIIDDLDELMARYRARGWAGVRQHLFSSDIYRELLGGRSDERDERTLYLGRAMAAVRLIAASLVDTKAIEEVGEREGIDAAAALLGVQLPV